MTDQTVVTQKTSPWPVVSPFSPTQNDWVLSGKAWQVFGSAWYSS